MRQLMYSFCVFRASLWLINFILDPNLILSLWVLLLADFSNRMHVLLLISTVSCYSIVGFGLIALGAHINRGIARLLKALELTHGNVSSTATNRQ